MTDFTGIPRAFDVREAKRAREEEARKREQATSARNTSSTTVGAGGRLDIDGGDLTVLNGGNASVKDGGRFLVEGGGSMDIIDDGEVTVSGQGIDGFTNEPIVSRLKFGNREAVHSWTGLSFLQPGVYLEGETPGNILETPRLTGVINRDGLMTRSGRRPSEGRPANIMEQSSALCTPWSASMGTIRYDSLVNIDGEDGLAGREFDSSFSTIPGVANGMVEDVLNHRAYYLNLSADAAMATSGKTGAVLAISSWHMAPSTGWIRVDDGGLIDIQATVGTKTVGITSEVAGKLQLLATDGVNVQGPFTVDGAPIGTPIVDLAATGTDLNSYVTNGLWHQAANAGATAGLNYPIGAAGLLEVVTRGAMVYQSYTTYSDASGATMGSRVYVRGKYNSTWRSWKLLADQTLATAAVDGLMVKTDKSKIDGSTPSATALRVIQRDSLGRAQVTDPAVAADISTKGYTDAAVKAVKPGAWATIPAATGWEPQDVDPTECMVANGVTYFRGKFHRIGANTTAGNTSGSALLLGTVPVGARPSSPKAYVCLAVWGATSVTSPCRIEVQTDGRILMFGIGDQGVFTAFSVTTATYVHVSSINYPIS